MTTRVAEGLEGARQERLVHLFSHLLLPKRTRALPSLYLEKRRDCLQSLRAWRKKNLSMNVISNNNKTENYRLTTFTFIFTFSNAMNFLCFLNIGTQRKLRIKLC